MNLGLASEVEEDTVLYKTDPSIARSIEKKDITALAAKRGTGPRVLYAKPPRRAPSPDPRPQWMLSTMAWDG